MSVSKTPKIIALILLSFTLYACGGGTNSADFKEKDNKQIALDKISLYAEKNGISIPPPTVQDYLDAGIPGVTNTNLLRMNQAIANLSRAETDTEKEILSVLIELTNNSTSEDNEVLESIELTLLSVIPNNITDSSVKINWQLSKPATAQVEFGKTINYGNSSTKNNTFKLSYHIQALKHLEPNTVYHFRVLSESKDGNKIISKDYTFKTKSGDNTLKESNNTPYLTAMEKIISYVNGDSDSLTLQDYIEAGINNVTSNNLNQVNKIVRNSTVNNIKTQSKLQKLINSLVQIAFSSITVTGITETSARVSWDLSSTGTGQVEYGLTPAYNNLTQIDNTLARKHNVSLVNLLPNTQYHYRVISIDKSGVKVTSPDHTFKTTGVNFSSGFDITQIPPVLNNPTLITLPDDIAPKYMNRYSACGVGYVYELKFSDNEDALITFNGSTPLPYPVHITGGKNIIARGLDISLQRQPGNAPGSFPLFNKKYNSTNPHWLVPGCQGLKLRLKRSTYWIEGLNLDTNGHDADGIGVQNADPTYSKVVIQNSLIKGIEGNMDIHGDVFQTQGGHLKYLIFENVTTKTAYQGITLSAPVDVVLLRNVDHSVDTRFDSDDPWDSLLSGGFFADYVTTAGGVPGPRVKSFSISNLYVKYKKPSYNGGVSIGGQSFTLPETVGTKDWQGITKTFNPQVHIRQSPPSGSFVNEYRVGKNYPK